MAAVAYARCSNDCSGKGTCNSANQCVCFRNFHGPDCSHRLCSFSRAFVDNQLGDTNGDNDVSVRYAVMEGKFNTPQAELYSADYAAARDAYDQTATWDEAHFYRECSNKGLCDTTTGLCSCFPGYEGTSCARISCPKDCSGHGQCKNYEGTQYKAWDVEATTYCDCDAGYTGAGCESRQCPSGIDPVQAANLDTSRFERIAFRGIDMGHATDGAEVDARPVFGDLPFGDLFFTVTLTDEYGDEWTTETMTVKYDTYSPDKKLASKSNYLVYPRLLNAAEWVGERSRKHVAETLEDALEGLPHNVAGDVVVHEIYAMSGAYAGDKLGVDAQGDAAVPMVSGSTSTFYDSDPTGLVCGPEDIYNNLVTLAADSSRQGVTGCGLAIPSFGPNDSPALMGRTIGDGETVPDRDGNWDIMDTLACNLDGTDNSDSVPGRLGEIRTCSDTAIKTLSLVLPVCSGTTVSRPVYSLMHTPMVDDADNGVVTNSLEYAYGNANKYRTAGILPLTSDGTNKICDQSAGVSVDAGYVLGYAYYQWPHYNNDDDASKRFPLFVDPENPGTFVVKSDGNEDGGNPYPAFSDTSRHNQHILWDPTQATSASREDNQIAGLSLFIYFNKDTALHTAADNEKHQLRVDYYYNNKHANLFDKNTASLVAEPKIMGRTVDGSWPIDSMTGSPVSELEKVDGSGYVGDKSLYTMVRVDDFTGARVWDVSYHGREQYFLGQYVSDGTADGQAAPAITFLSSEQMDPQPSTGMMSPTDSDAQLHVCSKRGLCDYTTGLCNCFSGYTGAGCGSQNALAF